LEVRPLTSAGLLILLQFLNPQDITPAETQIAALQLRTTRSALTCPRAGAGLLLETRLNLAVCRLRAGFWVDDEERAEIVPASAANLACLSSPNDV
jgi:hypothetical protein